MTVKISRSKSTLYEQDYCLWLLNTVTQLRQGNFSDLDVENLIEEIESMGKSQRHARKSFLKRLLEHLLKLAYWESERQNNYRHWCEEIYNFRDEIQDLLADSPSLKPYLQEIFNDCYISTVDKITWLTKIDLPIEPTFSLEQVLDKKYLPINIDDV
jgi:Domain of unknown function DUF29